MKILHIITSLRTGGAEKLMVDLLPRLRDLGNEVELLLFDGTKTPFYETLKKEGIKIHYLQIGGSVYNPLNLYRIIPFLKKYDIVHTHNTAPQLFVAMDKIFCKGKLFNTEHSTSNRRRKWKWFRYIDRWMYSQYNKVICISDIAEKKLRDYLGGNLKNLCTINNGIDVDKFKNASPCYDILEEYKGKRTAIMVAGFRWEKDHVTLIKAYKHLPDNYHLLLAGTGVLQNELEELCRELGLEKRIHFLGMREDIPQLLKSVDVIIMSSHFEGLSLSSLEGMASGKPFIASDVAGLHEIVNGYGVLFPHGDALKLAESILKVCENEYYRKDIAQKCQIRAINFDISSMAMQYNNIYHNNN